MKMCSEIEQSIEEVCEKYHQDDMIEAKVSKLIQSVIDDRFIESDLHDLLEKVVIK